MNKLLLSLALTSSLLIAGCTGSKVEIVSSSGVELPATDAVVPKPQPLPSHVGETPEVALLQERKAHLTTRRDLEVARTNYDTVRTTFASPPAKKR